MSLTRIALATAFLFAIPDPAAARTIELPAVPEAGQDYAVLKGTLRGDTRYRFRFEGRAAETVTLALNASDESVRFRLTTAEGASVAEDTIRFWSGTLPATGGYDIEVYSSRPAHQRRSPFALTVTFGEPRLSGGGSIHLASN